MCATLRTLSYLNFVVCPATHCFFSLSPLPFPCAASTSHIHSLASSSSSLFFTDRSSLSRSDMALEKSEAAQDRVGLLPSSSLDDDGHHSTVDDVLMYTQYLYSLILLISFVLLAGWYSIYNAKKSGDLAKPTLRGPDGKPLPITRKKKKDDGERKLGPHFGLAAKNVFRYLAAVVFLTYVASGTSLFIHGFFYEDPYQWSRHGLPWAGDWTVVRLRALQNCADAFLNHRKATAYVL